MGGAESNLTLGVSLTKEIDKYQVLKPAVDISLYTVGLTSLYATDIKGFRKGQQFPTRQQ